ncbi:hemerythrin domain-containing protein [Massilia sp. TS11]|uniref:hemerythrin domain-containing protein n=1 Tax=Massilia sp. TS11 TaxID=2908003 RepID=UPI001EDB178F|nr:hemerythrin domain-containing protein [Massilia sp. TS11]MCG2584412.1 hemerythrin domain-containing protein [Massilia sp. TS11]
MPTPSDALEMLHADHERVLALFREFTSLKTSDDADPRRAELADEICYVLQLHTQLEEELFYPAVRAASEQDELLDEAEVEHAGAKDLISQLEVMYPGDDHYEATVAVLSEEVERHIETEELNIFPAARQARLDLNELGARMAQRRAELEDDFPAPPPSVTREDTRGGRHP